LSQMMEARKVQKVGYSTLIVSLPKDWVEQVSLKQGDIVTFRREPDGGITVYPGLTRERENLRYVINADICDAPNLLTRIITANYLTSRRGPSRQQASDRSRYCRAELEVSYFAEFC
jgi:phosphate uptake regulator